MPYKLVCFDMDGVLYSSEKMIAAAFRDAVMRFSREVELDVQVPKLQRIMEEVGRPIRTIYANLFPKLNQVQQERVSTLTLDTLEKRVKAREGTLLPGALQVLQKLEERGIAIGLASNGRERYLDAILQTYGMDRYFPGRAVIDGDKLPDKGSLITHAMQRYELNAEDTLMVGDRLTDYEAAEQAGVDFVCVLTGHGNDILDHQSAYSIRKLEELLPVVFGEEYARI